MNGVVIFSTASSEDEAASIASGLVKENLAACCNLFQGIRSIYQWEGIYFDEKEVFFMIKTTDAKVDEVVEYIRTRHSYRLPEIIAIPIVGGYDQYLQWLSSAVT